MRRKIKHKLAELKLRWLMLTAPTDRLEQACELLANEIKKEKLTRYK